MSDIALLETAKDELEKALIEIDKIDVLEETPEFFLKNSILSLGTAISALGAYISKE